jgi:hypothetical protein
LLILWRKLRVHFLCSLKVPTGHDKNEPKERAPDDLALRASLRFSKLENAPRPCGAPSGYSSNSCDARRRQREKKAKPQNWNLWVLMFVPSSLAEHRRDFAKERAVSERPKGVSLASAQNTEERKEPLEERRGIGCPFLSSLLSCPVGAFGQAKERDT